MQDTTNPVRRASAVLNRAALAALSFALAGLASAQTPAGQQAPAETGAPQSEVEDRGWPRQFEAEGHTVLVHQPQLEDWADFDRITFRAAVSVTPKGSEEPIYGVLVASADTEIAFEERLVVLSGRKIESLTFPDVEPGEAERLRTILIAAAPPERPQTISLDRLVAAMDISKVKVHAVDVNLAPPTIITSDKPAVMVIFMGKPRFKPIPDNDLLFAINTNWDVFLDPAAKKYYLLDDTSWLVTPDLEKGPWIAAEALPAGLSKLPADENWNDVRESIPGTPAQQIPAVFVSHEPAELVVTQGEPELEQIPGTGLFLVANTESNLFYNPGEKQYYLLTAGRWFKASALAGPWAAASDSLPADFKSIPEDSDAGAVLAAVPGTAQANEAIIMASVPNKATVSRSEVTVNVTYDGEPQFKPIETTSVQYAYNSPFNVFLVEGAYYCCHNAVWFVAPTPTGVWTVCDSVPAAIYSIPPTSPKHNVTYVTVYESTPTTVVTGYTSGYSGETVAATGVVMFGLGILVGAALDDDCCWQYHYNSCFFSYGCGAFYHGGCGGYVCGGRYYGPYGGAGRWACYNPATGIYSRGGFAYGPRGAGGYRAAYNPSTGIGGVRAGAVTPYGSWGRSAVSNGDDWVRAGHASGARGTVGGIQGSGGAGAVHAENRWGNGVTVARDKEGDIYAGKDGNVYKKTDDGWQQSRNAPSTTRTNQPPATRDAGKPATQQAAPARQPPGQAGDLQREAAARERGERNASRTTQFQRSGGRTAPSRGGRGRR